MRMDLQNLLVQRTVCLRFRAPSAPSDPVEGSLDEPEKTLLLRDEESHKLDGHDSDAEGDPCQVV